MKSLRIHLLLLLPLLISAKNIDNITELERDLKSIITVYERNAEPYLNKFGELQCSPLPNNPSKQDSLVRELEIRGAVSLHKGIILNFGEKVSKSIIEKQLSSYKSQDKKKLLESIELYYKCEFLYLDYTFFTKCRQEIKH